MKTTAVLFLSLFLATSAFCGGGACKVIIDYNSLIRSATDLSDLAAARQHPSLAAESHSLAKEAYGGWVGALEIVEYSSTTPAQMKTILDQSYLVCDWAKEVRTWCAALRSGPVSTATIEGWIVKMDGWMSQDETLIRSIAESTLPAGYSPPAH